MTALPMVAYPAGLRKRSVPSKRDCLHNLSLLSSLLLLRALLSDCSFSIHVKVSFHCPLLLYHLFWAGSILNTPTQHCLAISCCFGYSVCDLSVCMRFAAELLFPFVCRLGYHGWIGGGSHGGRNVGNSMSSSCWYLWNGRIQKTEKRGRNESATEKLHLAEAADVILW